MHVILLLLRIIIDTHLHVAALRRAVPALRRGHGLQVELVPEAGHHLGLEVGDGEAVPGAVAVAQLRHHEVHDLLVHLQPIRGEDAVT